MIRYDLTGKLPIPLYRVQGFDVALENRPAKGNPMCS